MNKVKTVVAAIVCLVTIVFITPGVAQGAEFNYDRAVSDLPRCDEIFVPQVVAIGF